MRFLRWREYDSTGGIVCLTGGGGHVREDNSLFLGINIIKNPPEF